ncbi:MAG: hypothetical protein ABIN48_02155 [Ginsengibacter sp.]
MRPFFKRLFLVFFTLNMAQWSVAQNNDVFGRNPPADPAQTSSTTSMGVMESQSSLTGDPGCDPLDPKCPIDGGLSALLVLGAGYGIRKVRKARKAAENIV